jgi:hypothetical protein
MRTRCRKMTRNSMGKWSEDEGAGHEADEACSSSDAGASSGSEGSEYEP